MPSLEDIRSPDERTNFVPRMDNSKSMKNLSASEERLINCSPIVWLIGERLYELYLDFTFRVKRGIPLHNTYLPRVVNSKSMEKFSGTEKRPVNSSLGAGQVYGKLLAALYGYYNYKKGLI